MKKMTPHILCGGRHTFNNGLKEDKGNTKEKEYGLTNSQNFSKKDETHENSQRR